MTIKAAAPAEQRMVLEPVSWATYVALSTDAETRRGRMAYDRGTLEIMSPSRKHESTKSLLGRLVVATTEETGVEIESGGSLTLRREDLERGAEPDECYYIAHADAVRGKDEIDLTVDPPPDLAIEVDITRSSIDKLAIYASLGVPELWRFDGETLAIHVRQADGSYRRVEQSHVLPQLPVEGLVRFLRLRGTLGESAIVRAFRAWLRESQRSSR